VSLRFTFPCALSALLTPLAFVPHAHPQAVPDKGWKPPPGWKKVADAQLTQVQALLARDGHLCWVESRLVPETARHRAPSYDRRLYRLRLGAGKPEQLYKQVSTGTLEALLGPGGAVVTRFDYPRQTLFLPGQPGLELPQVEGYHPQQFTPRGLLCYAQRYRRKGNHEGSLTLIPIVGGKGHLNATQQLLPWVEGSLGHLGRDFQHTDAFRTVGYLVHAHSPIRGPKGQFGKVRTAVWDEKNQRQAWTAEGPPLGADDRYAYSRTPAGIARRPLAGKGEGAQLALADLGAIINFQPPKLLALFRKGNEWVASLLDLNTGGRAEFDLRLPKETQVATGRSGRVSRPFHAWVPAPTGGRIGVPAAGDAREGALFAARGGAIYQVPIVRREQAKAPPGWEPLP
jgi:hypothetical protein